MQSTQSMQFVHVYNSANLIELYRRTMCTSVPQKVMHPHHRCSHGTAGSDHLFTRIITIVFENKL